MNRRTIGVILLVVGVMVFLLALGADLVGLGKGGAFGARQILGAGAGLILGIVGAVMMAAR